MRLALHQLGLHDVYHMSYYIDHTEDYDKWVEVTEDKIAGRITPRAKWDELLGNCQVRGFFFFFFVFNCFSFS